MPYLLEWSVKDRATWEALKNECLRIDISGRLPSEWLQQVAAHRRRDWPLVIGGPFLGVLSSLRMIIGLVLTRLMVRVLRHTPGDAHTVSDAQSVAIS